MVDNSLFVALGAWALTYLVHSTLLLGVAALLCRRTIRSHVLRERMWKSAAVAGVLTSALAAFGSWGIVVGEPVATTVEAEVDDDAARRFNKSFLEQDSTDQRVSEVVVERPTSQSSPSIELTAEDYAALEAHLAANNGSLLTFDAGPSLHNDLDAELSSVPPASRRLGPVQPSDAERRSTASITPIASELASALDAVASQREFVEDTSRFLAATVWIGVIVSVWFLIGLLRIARQEWMLARLLRSCSPITAGDVPRMLDGLLGDARRRPRVLMSSVILEPLACGVFRPTIVLPECCDERLQSDERQALLAHELAHLQRGDLMWLLIGRVQCACLGFQPLNVVARRAWQAAAEIQCDDWAIEHDVSELSLARCLTEIAEWRLDARPSSAVLTATSNGGPLTLRIERLLSDRVPDIWSTRWRSRLSVWLAFVCGLVFASYGPRLDESLWAGGDPDLAERLRLWDEISSEIHAVNDELSELNFKVPRP